MSSNPHDPSDPNRPPTQYPPPQWTAASHPDEPAHQSQYSYPPPASYAPPSHPHHPPPPHPPHPTTDQDRSAYSSSYPPPPPPPPSAQYPPPPANMAAIHPQVQGPQDPYRLPPPPGAYRPADVYAQPPPQVVYQAAAPRQRTAIACRYCRRRKIRCSGFESSQDGRCSNCIRFNQECMFTPVSSQAQAFVPAHAAYPHLRNPQNQGRPGVTLYGAHGQPLPPQQQPPPETTLPPPQGMYQHPYGRPPHLDDRSVPPPLAPPMPQDPRQPGARRGSGAGFEYPDPTNLAPVTPAVSSAGYPGHPVPNSYYPPPPQHDRRPSPQATYPYDSRHSSSPHSSSPYPALHPAQPGITPPPTSTAAPSRGGLNVRDMLNPGDQSHGRSSTDSDMLNALNRRGLNQ
ncbi:hypothetical protein ASPZODRAFT_136666 [Penicilliopsis zonata CBS 506.65]|uniref:Zn(2)-C6 fungal-type domain-containing protein n=1 Tax=Penicilliopsis zonata CBS 506.65 TaxID=1073090 RepID=A0A1L9S7H9_9EURO|nr:hypothetical protein ASPZODRAFT_136666 [Penicilliopsis zonata CBS 506.65]OJJ43111.1 hypothetical protein ASPZODRAFT_136666 [Penicilliopsis zonata CBS 506.65]